MNHEIKIEIAGLGIIFYSPFAVAHIADGTNFLSSSFWKPDEVAKYVNQCRIPAFCTGSPGTYKLRIFDGPYPDSIIETSARTIRLGIEVRDLSICFRDLYDLMDWRSSCPQEQNVSLADGFYRVTVMTRLPASGILGDNQEIDMYFEKYLEMPKLNWPGVPELII